MKCLTPKQMHMEVQRQRQTPYSLLMEKAFVMSN